jgi:hypothetical protein
MKSSAEEFVLVVRTESGWQAPVMIRLRQFLKTALRRWGIRVVSITPTPLPSDRPDEISAQSTAAT